MRTEIITGRNKADISFRTQVTEIGGLRTVAKGIPTEWFLKEDKSNKVQTLGADSTEKEYPSAKCVYEALQEGIGQVQADWTQTDTEAVDYIKNKPSLSAVATSGSYTDLSDKPVIPVVPTNVSSFTNDAGYITQSDIPTDVSDFNNDAGYITLTDVPEQVNSDWNSNSGKSQILNKPNLAIVATSGSYTDLSNKPDLTLKENVSNKVTSISSSSTDSEYPSALAVYNYIQSLDGSQISY